MQKSKVIGLSNPKILLLLFALLPFLCLPQAWAQAAGTASIQGNVIDQTGAAIPSATVTLTNTGTRVARTTVTDGSGLYSLPNVPIGPYSLGVSATGFQTYTQTGIVLQVGNNIQINATLQVGNASEHVEVQASAVALDTENSTFKQVIDQTRITEMPLNGRQATQLVLISGGAVNAPAADINTSKNYPTSVVIAVAGSQGNYNNYVLDGGYHTDNFTNTNLPYPFPDALHEFSVESSSLPARNGLHPGSLVNVVTNSGTNQWHGTVFDFVRNNVINATNFFSTAKDTVKRNQFGGTLGGKIISDKLFFFGGYQGTREHKIGNATGYCLPTPAMLNGDFSQMPKSGNCASTGAAFKDPLTGAANPSRKIPVSEFSPAALALVKYLPLSQADANGRVNVALPGNNTEDQYIGRIDYTWSARHSLFGRYYLTNYNLPSYYSPSNILLTTVAGNDLRVQSFTLGDTFIFTPKFVNTFHGTYSRRRNNRGPIAGGINANTLGVKIYLYAPVDLRVQMNSGFNVGCGTCTPGFFNVNTEHFADDIDWLVGKHQIALGGEFLRTGDNTHVGYLFNGSYSFGGAASGEVLADFLTGQMTSYGTTNAFSQSRAQDTTYRQNVFGLYAQDTWHITPKLTINYGLRWEPNLFQTDKFGRGSTFDQAAFNANKHSTTFPNAPAGSFYYGDAGVPKSFTNNQWKNVSPRVSMTLDPFGTGKTVFRAGGAMMYDTPALYTSQRVASNPPFVNEIDINAQTSFDDPWNGYPGGDPFPGVFPPNASATFPTNTLWVLLQKNMKTPVIYQWTASVQQDFGRGWMFSINYLGNQQAHQWIGNGINAAVFIPGNWSGPSSCQGMPQIIVGTALYPGKIGDPCSTVGNPNARTPLTLANSTQGQGYSPTMTLITDGGTTSYHGVITAIQHRMSDNFSFLANYTWSKCLAVADNPGDIAGPAYEHTLNPRLDRGPCGFDVRHIFNTSIVARSNFHSLQGWKGALANNWQVAPLIRILSGTPLNVTSGVDNSRSGIGLDRPNLVTGGSVYTGAKIYQKSPGNLAYLNKAAFAQNTVGTYGNLSRNAFRQPNYYNVDMSVSRIFPVHERLNFQLRMEAFNVLNHPNLNAFTTSLSSGTFGNATGAADPRIFQLAGKFNF
ncbi:TonB-dependent receptor [Edaphobacter albus]|uniref:TonB-dependent receptor n=1 Tax=Edaphobacter sp. 4G125 TaxID=2763071 RepID=UPI001648FEC9|nr:TonB-dependent receptor [Edaphobacter sp. 4G125]QNI37147.1 TonB-dependent receptor [Edaphobacter sp. 4G125]